MKKLLAGLLLFALAISPAAAVTFFVNGVLMGTVCRNGLYYTAYQVHAAQPVGSVCPVRDPYGVIIMTGVVTAE